MGSLVFIIQGEGEVVKNQNWEGGSLVFSIGCTGSKFPPETPLTTFSHAPRRIRTRDL